MKCTQNHYRIVTLIIMLFAMTSMAFAQEDCANGIDDDSDGLIDLNDPDCTCHVITADSITGHFEDMVCCPSNFSGLGQGIACSEMWSAAAPSPDYFNECDFMGTPGVVPSPPVPMPSGSGCMGFFSSTVASELIGQCLPFSFVAGQTYDVELFIGFNSSVVPSDSPFEFAIFGTPSCNNYPMSPNPCPANLPNWFELGSVSVSGDDNTWNFATFSFTPTQNIEAIAFGTSCNLTNPNFQYHFIDDLYIYGNYGSETVDVGPVSQSGDCITGVELSVTPVSGSTYQWYLDGVAILGATSSTFDVQVGNDGSYVVMIDNGSGCGTSDPIDVVIPTDVLDFTADVTDIACFGTATGSIDLNPPNDNPPYTIMWGPGQTTEDISNLFPGSYSVTVTDANGCYGIDTYFITQPDDALMVLVSNITHPIGVGALGSAEVSTTGGTPTYTYLWDNGENTEIAISLDPGIHFVTITDANGCEEVLSITINEPLVIEETIINETCFGYCDGSIELQISGGLLDYNISWSNGETDPTNSDLCEGTFTVTITDDAGTEVIQDYAVTSPNELVVLGTYSQMVCADENGWIELAPIGGTPGYTYVWSNGATDENIYDLVLNEYTVTVTDASGCSETETFYIDIQDPVVVTGDITQEGCGGGADGSIQAMAVSGSAPFQYDWNTGWQGSYLDGLISGTYVVTVTDVLGCTGSSEFIVSQGGSLDVIIDVENASCQGVDDGSISIQTNGGTPPYTYLWDSGETTSDISSLAAGIFTVTIADNGGCELVQAITVDENDGVEIAGANTTNTLCWDSNDGTIDLLVSNGNPPYSFDWSNSSNTQNISGLSAGGYSVTVTDMNGCQADASFIVNAPAQLDINGDVFPASCSGALDGQCEVAASGGIAPYTFLWSTGSTSNKIDALMPGDYTVTLTDANNCTIEATYTIDALEEISAMSVITEASCNGGSDGAIDVTSGGGTMPYTFLWSNGEITEDIQNIAAGMYTLTVTDANGCNLVVPFEIFGAGAISTMYAITELSCFGATDAEIDVSVNGGTTPYTFQWSNAETTEDVMNLAPGMYTLSITDAQGCELELDFTIDPVDEITFVSNTQNVACNGDMSGSISVTPSGGTPPFTYMWSNAEVTNEILNVGTGFYSVTISDMNGCTVENQFEITEPPLLNIAILNITNPTMIGEFGSAEIQITGGTAPYNINWANGETGLIAIQLNIGITNVVVTDANGCTTDVDVEITVSAFNVNYTVVNNACFGDCLGEIQLDVSGGLPPYTVLWSDGQSTVDAINLCNSLYSATITDSQGNDVETPVLEIVSPAELLVQSAASEPTCIENNDGAIEVTVSGGTGPYMYAWNTGSTQPNQSNLTPGQYNVTVTDDLGCTSEEAHELQGIESINVSLSNSNIDCDSLTGAIYIIGSNPDNYTYLINGTPIPDNDASAVYGLSEGAYTLEYQVNANCQVEIGTTQIETVSDFEIFADPENAEINAGESLEILLTMNGVIGNYNIEWITESTYNCIQEDSAGQCIQISVLPINSETISVFAIDEYQCEQVAFIDIVVHNNRSVFVPNVFTPNGDFVNDVFKPSSSDLDSEISHFYIYNRWGGLIYSEQPGNMNAMQGWDGESDSEVVAPGVYVYSIGVTHSDGAKEVISGDITVIR